MSINVGRSRGAAPDAASDKPVVFIGSSTEGGLPVVKQLLIGLRGVARCRPWSQGVFGLSKGTLESLVETTKSSDFAILVLTPDDFATKKGRRKSIPRDNVIFELGLFMGALGRERTFIVHDRDAELELPSDLNGITTATYSGGDDLKYAVAEAAAQLEIEINQRGRREGGARSTGVMVDLLGAWRCNWGLDERYAGTPYKRINDTVTFHRIEGERVFAKGVNREVGTYDLVGRVSTSGVLTFYYESDAHRHFCGGVAILKLKTNSRRSMSGLWYEYDADRVFYGGATVWEKAKAARARASRRAGAGRARKGAARAAARRVKS